MGKTGSMAIHRMVIEADHPLDYPYTIFQLPESHEFCFSELFGIIGVRKAMDADLHRAKSLEGIDLKRALNQLAMHLAADIVLDGVHERLAPNRQTV